jgi:glycosyltransferase involved in cell wall biosynthesis
MSNPIRVLYVLNSAGGGATQGILELLSGLPSDRYQAYAVVPGAPDDFQRENLTRLTRAFRVVPMAWWNRKVNLSRWNRLRLWAAGNLRTGARLRSVMQLVQLIRAWKIDMVYTSTAMMLDGALAARLTRRPHLWHIKEWVGEHARTRFLMPDPFLARLFLNLSDRVLVMSRFIGQLFEDHGMTDRMVLVNDGVDTARFRGDLKGRDLRLALGVKDDEVLVGMAASLSSTWKKHSLFIEMAADLAPKFPHVRFAMFGPEPKRQANSMYNQPWSYFEGLKQQTDRLGLKERFIWAGFCRDIPQMMDALDVLVHTCDIEPFGRVAIEAMAAGRPVVGPDKGGISESVVHGQTGLLVPSGDAGAFAAATGRLITDSHLRKQMGAAGRVRAATFFSIDQHVQHIEALYREVLNNKGVSR